MDWVSRKGRNVWGVIPGHHPELGGETIVVQAYYDGISIVPSLAPSAETAGGIAALLELARHLQRHPPARTVVLVAAGAHFLAQRGIVDFLDRHARTHEDYAGLMEKPLNPDLFIGLDLTSGSDRIGIWNNTDRYDIKRFYVPFGRAFTAYAGEAAPRLGRRAERALVNGISPLKGLDWSTYVPGGVTVDGQVAMAAGLVALSFVTIGDGRFVVDTPPGPAAAGRLRQPVPAERFPQPDPGPGLRRSPAAGRPGGLRPRSSRTSCAPSGSTCAPSRAAARSPTGSSRGHRRPGGGRRAAGRPGLQAPQGSARLPLPPGRRQRQRRDPRPAPRGRAGERLRPRPRDRRRRLRPRQRRARPEAPRQEAGPGHPLRRRAQDPRRLPLRVGGPSTASSTRGPSRPSGRSGW